MSGLRAPGQAEVARWRRTGDMLPRAGATHAQALGYQEHRET